MKGRHHKQLVFQEWNLKQSIITRRVVSLAARISWCLLFPSECESMVRGPFEAEHLPCVGASPS